MGVAGGRGDLGVAHHGFAGVFGRAGFGEVGGEEVACRSHGDVWEFGVLEGAFPSSQFDAVGQGLAVPGEYELVGFALPASGESPEPKPGLVAQGDESFAVFAFGLDEPVLAGEVPASQPVGYSCLGCDALELPAYLDAVHAVLGGQGLGGQGEAFALAHAGFEGEVEHEAPHFVVVVVVFEHVPFAFGWLLRGLCGAAWLSGAEDPGGR